MYLASKRITYFVGRDFIRSAIEAGRFFAREIKPALVGGLVPFRAPIAEANILAGIGDAIRIIQISKLVLKRHFLHADREKLAALGRAHLLRGRR